MVESKAITEVAAHIVRSICGGASMYWAVYKVITK